MIWQDKISGQTTANYPHQTCLNWSKELLSYLPLITPWSERRIRWTKKVQSINVEYVGTRYSEEVVNKTCSICFCSLQLVQVLNNLSVTRLSLLTLLFNKLSGFRKLSWKFYGRPRGKPARVLTLPALIAVSKILEHGPPETSCPDWLPWHWFTMPVVVRSKVSLGLAVYSHTWFQIKCTP